MSDNTLFINNKPDKYPIQFWLLMISCFINSMAQMITVFISLFLHKNNFSMGDIGIFISLFGIGGVIGGYVGGYISDYISPLKVTRYSSLLNAIAIMLFLLSTNYFYIGIILLIMGLANNLFRPASLLLILSFDKIGKPSIIMSYRRVFVNLGTAIGVMVSGILFNYNPILVFVVCSSLVLLSYIILQFIKTDYNKIKTEAIRGYTFKKYQSSMYLAVFFLFLCLIIYNQQQTTYSIFLNDFLHINTIQLSSIFAINGIIVVICQIPITKIFRHTSAYTLSAIGCMFIGVGFGLIVFNFGYLTAIISVILWSIGELLLFPSAFDIILELGSNNKGKDMGLYQSAFSISSFIGPSIGTIFYGINSYSIWFFCVFLGAISFVGFLYIKKDNKI